MRSGWLLLTAVALIPSSILLGTAREDPGMDAPDVLVVGAGISGLSAALVEEEQTGFAHFERVYRVVLAEDFNCGECHAELSPFDSKTHQIDRMAQRDTETR